MEHAEVTRFTSLWTQAQTSVFAVISATVTNFADAEDVLQKVSTIAVSKFDDFETNGDANAFAAWATAIAVQRAPTPAPPAAGRVFPGQTGTHRRAGR